MLTSFKYFLLVFSLLIVGEVYAQVDSTTHITVGSSLLINPSGLNNELPFWLHANRNGAVNQYSSNALIYSSISSNLLQKNNFRIDAGGTVVTQYSEDPTLFFNTLFAEATLGGWKLSVGRFIDPLTEKEDDLVNLTTTDSASS
ncbi:MAG: hypothetical protein WD059_08980 [Balneolaceae bacterium]